MWHLFRARSVYNTGAWISGIGAAAFAAPDIYRTMKKQIISEDALKPHKRRSFKEYCTETENDKTSCAVKISHRIITTILVYPLHLGESNETVVKLFHYGFTGLMAATGSCAVGTVIGLTWPLSLPLLGMYKLETDYGYKFC